MTTALVILFWISLVTLFYCYIGYGIIISMIVSVKQFFRKQKRVQGKSLLPVTLIVTAYNEEEVLQQKVLNTLAIDYPSELLQLIFITDGSSDGSVNLLRGYPAISVLHQSERKGKYAAIKRAMKQVQTPVVVFSDANTLLNSSCIREIMAHYDDEKTGAVAGEKKIIRHSGVSAVGEAEGIYWRYESSLKKIDAALNTVTGAAGELFSIRTGLFRELDDELILDDFVISMQICLQGYRIAYEPAAFATELPSVSLAEEEKRKVRISAGAYQSIGYLKGALNFFKHPLLSFQFISRRLLRWIFCPLMLITLALSDIMIVLNVTTGFYNWILYAQISFYLFAFIGWFFVRSGTRIGALAIPFYFVFMNYCLVKGFFRFINRRQSVLWEKSMRQAIE